MEKEKKLKYLVRCKIEVDYEDWEYDKNGIGFGTELEIPYKGRITEDDLELLKKIVGKFLYYKKAD